MREERDELSGPTTLLEPADRCLRIMGIAGGKGGCGKSFCSSQLGLTLARMGYRVVLLDGDLGGANLHTFLRIRRPQETLSDFFDKRRELRDILTPTPHGNLKLIAGDLHAISPQGPQHAQRQRLLRHLHSLEADILLIDLGAGSHLQTLDVFLACMQKILVITPEPTSIENMFQFVRKLLFRQIQNCLEGSDQKEMIRQALQQSRVPGQNFSLPGFLAQLKALGPDTDNLVRRALERLGLNLCLNQSRGPADRDKALNICHLLENTLSIRTRLAGTLPLVPHLWNFLEQGTHLYPTPWQEDISRLSDTLLLAQEDPCDQNPA